MTYKRRALSALSKAELLDAGRSFDLDVTTRNTVEELQDEIGRSRRATLDKILSMLSRDTLKAVCTALGLTWPSVDRHRLFPRPSASGPRCRCSTSPRPLAFRRGPSSRGHRLGPRESEPRS